MNNHKLCSWIPSVSMYVASNSQLTVGWELCEYKKWATQCCLGVWRFIILKLQEWVKTEPSSLFTETEVKDCVCGHPCFMRPSLCHVSCLVFYRSDNTPWPKVTLRGRGWFYLMDHSPSLREVGAGTQGHNPEARNWSMDYGGITLTGLLSLLSCITQEDHLDPRVAPPTVGWAFAYQSLMKKMLSRLAHRQSLS